MSTAPVNLVEVRTPNVTREPPDWIVREIQKVGGMVSDGNGRQPYFRIIWGGNRWSIGEDGRTLIRPYRVDMWHLEKMREGQYEHCYRIGECPVGPDHRKTKRDAWCRVCFMSGGISMEPDHCWPFLEGLIRMILKTEEMQRCAIQNQAARDQQKDALFDREKQKEKSVDAGLKDLLDDAMPKNVKRSFDAPMNLTADQALGRRGGIRQLNAREIARGLRKRRA